MRERFEGIRPQKKQPVARKNQVMPDNPPANLPYGSFTNA